MIHTPPAQCMLGYDQQAGGTHPTGMHSCLTKLVSVVVQLSPVFRSYYIVEKGGLFVFEFERLTLNFFMGQIFLNPFFNKYPLCPKINSSLCQMLRHNKNIPEILLELNIRHKSCHLYFHWRYFLDHHYSMHNTA